MLIRMLTVCANGWPPISHTLLENNISDSIQILLTGSISVYKPGSAREMVRTAENLSDVVSFIDALLPSVEDPKDSDSEVAHKNHNMRVAFMKANPDLASNLGRDLLPLLLRVGILPC